MNLKELLEQQKAAIQAEIEAATKQAFDLKVKLSKLNKAIKNVEKQLSEL